MASRRLEERRIAFQRYKDDVKQDGKPFYPYAMFHDTVMSLIVVAVIDGLAFVWHYTDLLGPPSTVTRTPPWRGPRGPARPIRGRRASCRGPIGASTSSSTSCGSSSGRTRLCSGR